MKVITIIFMVAITMALSITLISNNIGEVEEVEGKKVPFKPTELHERKPIPSKKVSRFLKEEKNPRAADHCHKNKEICFQKEGYNSTCCNNKCVDLATDNSNCGACKNKCEFTEACCRGKCVNLAYDKRHCGSCNNRCNEGLFCIYGMCDYP